jgi:hypothetical protein
MLRFSEAVLLAVIAAKPAMDALYMVPLAKYVYMLALICAGLLAYAGKGYAAAGGAAGAASSSGSALPILFWTFFYASFLLVLSALNGGSLHEIFKIVSPFLFYSLVRGNVSARLRYAILALALIVVFANAALLPFDYGWTYWGSVRTFKGFYYFKTDLAFSVVTSLLIIGMFFDFKPRPLFVLALLVGAVEVVLSNARLNYLTFALFLVFLLWRNGVSIPRLLGSALIVGAIAALVLILYDPGTYLSPFDITNLGKFTQGRERIWDTLVNEGIMKADLVDALFGRGMWFDWAIINEYGYGFRQAHNAHNELFHLLLTQGLMGLFLYLWLWVCVTRDTLRHAQAPGDLAIALVALALLVLQSLTAVVSSYASKTWPVVLVMLMLQAQHSSRAASPARSAPEDRAVTYGRMSAAA